MAIQGKGILDVPSGKVGSIMGYTRNGQKVVQTVGDRKGNLNNINPMIVPMECSNINETVIVDNNVFAEFQPSSTKYNAVHTRQFVSQKGLFQLYIQAFQSSMWFIFRQKGDGYNYLNSALSVQFKYARLNWYSYGKGVRNAFYSYSYKYWRIEYRYGVFTSYGSIDGVTWFTLESFSFPLASPFNLALQPSNASNPMQSLMYKQYQSETLSF